MKSKTSKWLESILLVGAGVALGWCGLVLVQRHDFQAAERERLRRSIAERTPVAIPSLPPEAPLRPAAAPAPPRSWTGGKIEMPRLGISAMVKEGDDDQTLRLAVGHIPGTAVPGEGGNVALAGHRDSFFRPLKDARIGDDIVLTTPEGRFSYTVDRIEVVSPTQVSVLAPTGRPSVTLVTCYPFHYIGHAPERFIVRGVRAAANESASGPPKDDPIPPR
jgi:sortase A